MAQMMLAHGAWLICPLEISAIVGVITAIWAMRLVIFGRVKKRKDHGTK